MRTTMKAALLLSRISSSGALVWAITQTLSAEQITNAEFNDTTGTFPTGFSYLAGTSGGDPGVSAVAPNGGAGTGGALFTSSVTANSPQLAQACYTPGDYVEVAAVISARTSGALRASFDVGSIVINSLSAAAATKVLMRSDGSGTIIARASGAAPHSFVLDKLSLLKLTLNTQQVAPSADMRLDLRYTLPASPVAGSAIWLLPRISDFDAGNYWVCVLEYTGSQWNITLYTVASHSRTSRIAATNIGATNGVRINMNANSISLYTTADDFGSVTQRGTTITNTTYQTATGVNAIHTSDFTEAVTITYEAAS